MAEITPATRKRSSVSVQKPNWNKCLCHVKEKVEGKLTSFTDKSWKKFESCSSRRKDAMWTIMKDYWDEGPKGGYHRQCYQVYTDINKMKKIEQNQSSSRDDGSKESVEPSTSVEPPPKRVCRLHLPKFDIGKCVICQKDMVKPTKGKGTRTREPLTLNISEFGSATLIKAAQIRNDSCMLLHIEGQDTIAMEIKYHRSCYKDYVRPQQLIKLEEQNCHEEDKRSESYNKAFSKVKELVEKEVFSAGKAISMSVLVDRYTSFLAEEGINAMTYRSSKLKNRLTQCFGKSLSFHRPLNQNQSEIVYSSHVKTGDVVEIVFMNNSSVDGEQVDENDSEVDLTDAQESDSRQVYFMAKLIRSLVVNMKPTMPWPPSSEDLESSSALVPDLLYNMMAWILSSKSEYSVERVSNLPPKVHCLVLSLSQDAVSRGRIKTPKHVVLPMTVKSLTGNVELITIFFFFRLANHFHPRFTA